MFIKQWTFHLTSTLIGKEPIAESVIFAENLTSSIVIIVLILKQRNKW